MQIIHGTERNLPHTYLAESGKRCDTNRWIGSAFLVFDPDIEDDIQNPKLGIRGPGYEVYYPNSTKQDYLDILSSASSGRWLHQWGEASNYEALG
jgi:hypothetical protein